MTSDTQLRRIGKLEAKRAISGAEDLAGRLDRARLERHDWQPPFTAEELLLLSARDDMLGRIARGLQRAEVAAQKHKRPSLIAPSVKRRPPAADPEQLLIEICGALTHRLPEFVRFAIPDFEPRAWQDEVLDDIGTALEAQALVGVHDAIRRAIGSGHSAGKTGLASALIIWAMSTAPDTRVIVLANTEQQLMQRNWPDLQRFLRSSLTSHWFEITATQMYSRETSRSRTWHAAAVTWSADRIEGVQGLHQGGGGRRILVVTDECSAHPPALWQALTGVLVDRDVQIVWLATGNPLRSSGPFYDALMSPNSPWSPRFIDTRTIPELNQSQIESLVIEYGGLESDLTRTRILGLPPRAGDTAFFNRADVELAMQRPTPAPARGYPLVIGVDVARRGGDASVLTFRHHLDARSFPPIKLYGLDLMALAARVAAEANKLRALGLQVVIMVDGTGLGAGVVDRLRQLGFSRNVVDVQFAAKAPDLAMAANLRAWMHLEARSFLRKGGALPNDPRLLEQMAAIEYGHTPTGAVILERKDDLRDKLGYSPDELDSLCCTFAAEVNLDLEGERASRAPRVEHDPYVQLALEQAR